MRQLGRSRPGRRFLDHYHRSQGTPAWRSALVVMLGVVMVLAGLIISLPPGLPGFLLWIPGFALIASQIKRVAIALDKLECMLLAVYHKFIARMHERRKSRKGGPQ